MVKVSDAKPGESDVYRSPNSAQGLFDKCTLKSFYLATLEQVFSKVTELFPDKEFLGTNVNGEYQYKTYSQVKKIAEQLGSALLTQGLANEVHEYKAYKYTPPSPLGPAPPPEMGLAQVRAAGCETALFCRAELPPG